MKIIDRISIAVTVACLFFFFGMAIIHLTAHVFDRANTEVKRPSFNFVETISERGVTPIVVVASGI